MEPTIYSAEHGIFREAFRTFLHREVVPNQERWMHAGIVDRDVWRKAGAGGFLCAWLPEQYGGPGADFSYSCVVMEELSAVYESGLALPLHSDVIVPYVHRLGTEEQKHRWLPGCASGDVVTAIAMTEPGTGSDLAAIATAARRDGDHWVINGSKTFISNGLIADLVIVVANTGGSDGHHGLSLFLVPSDAPGFVRGRKLRKMGLAAQDTAELSFQDCRVPADALLGELGSGFLHLMQHLQQERLVVAIGAQALAEQVLKDTVQYCKDRRAFGRPIAKFQNTAFKLAECATKIEVGRAFLDRLVREHMNGQYLVKECSMAKCWQTDMLNEVVDECVQLFGGYGYMLEYPVARAFVDARVQKIFAGTNEIMKVIIAKQMGLD